MVRTDRGIFAFLHELLGLIFDEKAFHDAFPKVMLEYTKKCDPDLPFYHYTGVNERFRSGCLPSFNEPSGNREERLDRVTISRRADPGVSVANRASAFRISVRWPIYIINSVDKTKF